MWNEDFCGRLLQFDDDSSASLEPDAPPSSQVHQISAAALQQKTVARELGLINLDEEGGVFAAALLVDHDYSNHDHRATCPRNDSELNAWLRYKPAEQTVSSLEFRIRQSRDGGCPFP